MAILEITTMLGCPLMCTFCPQETLRKNYVEKAQQNDKYLSIINFQKVLNNLPSHVQIHFSGMAEPWANPQATTMLELALQGGFVVSIYTTLYGISSEESKKILSLARKYNQQIKLVCLHLPDRSGNMKGFRYSDEYRAVLINFLAFKEENLIKTFQVMTMDSLGSYHESISDLLKPKIAKWAGMSRAGSLPEDATASLNVPPPRITISALLAPQRHFMITTYCCQMVMSLYVAWIMVCSISWEICWCRITIPYSQVTL